MNKQKIILSYDYELFFGERSGTVLMSIVEPTNMLMDVMEKNGFRGNFFVDYLMFRELEKLNDAKAVSDLNLLKNQIRDLILRGHRIELHLHPHWIDAKYNGDGTWDFADFTHYSLSSLDEETIVGMFKDGTNYLTSLAREVKPDYKIVAFRAGGWAVQPFDKLKRAFIESGIVIDSSTSYGIYRYMKDSYYDFRQMPNKPYYHFEDDVCKEVENGQFLEVPISSFHRNMIQVLIDRYFERRLKRFKPIISDGSHKRKGLCETVPMTKLSKFSKKYKAMYTFSTRSSYTLLSSLFFRKTKKLCCFIDHPKDLSLATIEGIKCFSKSYQSLNYIDLL